MAIRSRKRTGNDGGGFPLGALLGAVLPGDGSANPAFGATAPGDVDFNYKGDPSKAIAKWGTQKPFKPTNIFRQVSLGQRDGNVEFEMYNAKQAEDLKRVPQEVALRRGAEAAADQDRQNREDIRLARDLATWHEQEQARTGELVPMWSPQDLRYRFGTRSATIGIPAAEVMAREAEGEMPLASEAARIAQADKMSRGRLDTDINTSTLGFRQRNPSLVNESIAADFLKPSLANDLTRKHTKTAGGLQIGDVYFPDATNLDDFVTVTPGRRGEQIGFDDKSKTPTFSPSIPPNPIHIINGDVVRRREPQAPTFGNGPSTQGATNSATTRAIPAPEPQRPSFSLMPSLTPNVSAMLPPVPLSNPEPHAPTLEELLEERVKAHEAAKRMQLLQPSLNYNRTY